MTIAYEGGGSGSGSGSGSNHGDEPGVIAAVEWSKLRPPAEMAMPAHGIRSGARGVVYCAQGTPERASGGLFFLPHGRRPVPVVTNYYGRPFNSPYCVAQLGDVLAFTDPAFGYDQDFRSQPQLPGQAYAFNPQTAELRVLADGFERPTGIAFGPGEVAYIADAGAVRGDGTKVPSG